MMVRKNKKKVRNEFIKGNLDKLEILIPNISDYVMEYADKNLELDKIIADCLKHKTHEDAIQNNVFIYALLSAKLKRLFSISEATVAITTQSIIDKYEINIASGERFTCESNIRKFVKNITTTTEVTQEQVKEEIEKREQKNKKIKDEKKKKILSEEIVKKELQIYQDGNVLVNLFNDVSKKLIERTERPKIHILDCVKLPVNISNTNYELSSVINYEGKPMRGYKMGVLRGVTDTGNIIERLIAGTIAKNDMALVEDEIVNYAGFNVGDYLLADRGFAKIEFIAGLFRRGINTIIPVKKNMDIFKECIKLALSNDSGWYKHPNSKRKGQEIKLITNLKGLWIEEKYKTRKPQNMLESAIDFNACVIRIDKTEDKNKDIIEANAKASDDTDELYEDNKYIYYVITTTDTNLTAGEIVRYYELRPEIEEDFRQLKDIWKICSFNSTKYIFVMCQICMTFLAYNLFNLFKKSEAGLKYLNKSMKKIANEEQRDRVTFAEASYLIVTKNYYAIFTGEELLDMYADCNLDIRQKIKPLLV